MDVSVTTDVMVVEVPSSPNHLCLATTVHVAGREGFDAEPYAGLDGARPIAIEAVACRCPPAEDVEEQPQRLKMALWRAISSAVSKAPYTSRPYGSSSTSRLTVRT